MGAVYLGERNDGQIEQKVAIKFVYPSIVALAGEDFLQKEAQHLANLEHTNIAKIYTVDTTDDELPYMMMEYVEGVPIDQYCDDNKLDLKARLKLFQKVCNAVHEAHQNMVIHADIKPSNILVDKQGEPKLMDFGIARNINQAIDSEADNSELRRQYLQAVSHAYASPEQINGEQLTAACDVYSLGKLLAKIIKKQPKTQKLNELHAIINHSCTASSSDRHASVFELSKVIKHQMNGYPVDEYSHNTLYKLTKYINRHMMATILSSVLLITLSTSSSMLYMQNLALVKQTEIATETSLFITDIFRSADSDNAAPTSVFALLEKSRKELKGKTFSSVQVLVSIKITIAQAYKGIGQYDITETILLAAKSVLAGTTLAELLFEVDHRLAMLYIETNKFEQAYALLEKNYNTAGKSTEQTLMNAYAYGDFYHAKGKFSQAIKYFQQALAGQQARSVQNLDTIATILNNLGNSYQNNGDEQKALDNLFKSLEISQQLYGLSAHPKIATRLNNIGGIYASLKDFKQAITYFENSLAMFKMLEPSGHKKEAGVINNLGSAYSEIGDTDNALKYLNLSLNKVILQFGDNHINTAILSNNIANTYRDNEQISEAINLHIKAISILEVLDISGITLAIFKSSYVKTLIKEMNFKLALVEVNAAINLLTSVDKEHRGLKKLAALKEKINILSINKKEFYL